MVGIVTVGHRNRVRDIEHCGSYEHPGSGSTFFLLFLYFAVDLAQFHAQLILIILPIKVFL